MMSAPCLITSIDHFEVKNVVKQLRGQTGCPVTDVLFVILVNIHVDLNVDLSQ